MAAVAVLASCSRRPVNISISNQSGTTLSNLSVNSDHYAQPIGSLAPGTSTNLVYPQSDSRGWLYFEAEGKKVESRGSNYTDYFKIDSQRPRSLVIGADLGVAVSGGAKGD